MLPCAWQLACRLGWPWVCWQDFPGTLSSPWLLPAPLLLPAFASTVLFLNLISKFIFFYHSTSHSLKLVLILWQLLSPCSCSQFTFLKHLATAISSNCHYWPRTSVLQLSSSFLCIICNCPNALLTIASPAFSSSAVTLAIPAASWLNWLLCPYLSPSLRREVAPLNCTASALQVAFPLQVPVMFVHSQNKVEKASKGAEVFTAPLWHTEGTGRFIFETLREYFRYNNIMYYIH